MSGFCSAGLHDRLLWLGSFQFAGRLNHGELSEVFRATVADRPKAVIHHIRMYAEKPPFAARGRLSGTYPFLTAGVFCDATRYLAFLSPSARTDQVDVGNKMRMAMNETSEAPRSVILAVALFFTGLVINYAVVVVPDLPNLRPRVGESALSTFLLFVIAHVTVVPLFTLPLWLPQLSCLWPTYLGKNWGRYLLLFSTVPVWFFLLRPDEFHAAFQIQANNHIERVMTCCARVAAALTQLAALIILWAANSSRSFFTSTQYRR